MTGQLIISRGFPHILSQAIQDRIGAAVLLVEIGTDMKTFGSADLLANWAGMCPGNNESTGKRNPGRVQKGASAACGSALSQSAQSTIQGTSLPCLVSDHDL